MEVSGTGVVSVPAGVDVRADKFKLDTGETLTGTGTFGSPSFLVNGGSINNLTVTVLASDSVGITGDVTFSGSTIKDYGTITWFAGDISTSAATFQIGKNDPTAPAFFDVQADDSLSETAPPVHSSI